MVKPSGKSKAKSKRITCRQKHKVAARVREHARKERKEAKLLKASGYAPKQKRDPGVPALHPLKEEILRKAEALKERMEAEKERQKQNRQKLIADSRKMTDLEELQRQAASRSEEFDKLRASVLQENDGVRSEESMNENSRRAYYKEFKKVVDDSDVVLEVLDARDPLGCRCASVEQAVVSSSKKRLVLVLNKTDLVPREVVEKWLKYLRQDYPTIAFKASTQTQRDHLSQSSRNATGGSDAGTSECFGASTLIKLLANYTRNANIKTAIRVGIVGYPNVGKSSIINSLKRARVVGVANTPGHTKHAQEISLDSKIKLLDSPGIVFSKGESEEDLILRNCVKLETLQDPVKAVEAILKRCNKEQIIERYMVPDYSGAVEFLQHMSRRLGRLKKGGIPDIAGSARVLLQDWNDGRISYYCLPPAESAHKAAHVSSAVVSGWGKEFDLASLLKEESTEMETLRPQKDYEGLVAMTSSEINQSPLVEDDDDTAAAMQDDGHESEDLMSEDEAPAAKADSKFITSAKPTKAKAAAAAAKAKAAPRKVVQDVESVLNRQVNKSKKKQLKQQRRDTAKGLGSQTVGGAYDFSTDFTARGGMDSDDGDL